MNGVKLQTERKLIKALKSRSKTQNPDVPKDFIQLMQKTKEFKDLSVMAISEIFKESELIELSQKNDQDTFLIKDQIQLDFFYCLKGECSLVFNVDKVYDPNDIEEKTEDLNLDQQRDDRSGTFMQKFGRRLNTILIKPYFQTELTEVENSNKLIKEEPEIQRVANLYLEDPSSQEQSLTVEGPFKVNWALSLYSLPYLKPNFQEYYNRILKLIKDQQIQNPMIQMPKKISKFQDRLVEIKTIEEKSVLLRLPQKKMINIVNSFWSNYNEFADLLYTHVPLLSSYTLKQKQKLLSTFQEEHYAPNQTIFRENQQIQSVYLVVDGQIKLTTTNNPYTKKYFKQQKLQEDSDKHLINNSAGLGNISKTLAENSLGFMQRGQWLGEEFILMKMPILYTAVAVTDVKLLKVNVHDFQMKFPQEIQKLMEVKTIEKLEWIRERLEKCHKIRKEIADMDMSTKTYETTISHIQNTYPMSSIQAQLNIRKAVMEQSSHNPNLLLFSCSQRIEKMREKEENITGKQSFKSYLFEQEKIKNLKLRLARSLRKNLGPSRPSNNYEPLQALRQFSTMREEDSSKSRNKDPQQQLIKLNTSTLVESNGYSPITRRERNHEKGSNDKLSNLKINITFSQKAAADLDQTDNKMTVRYNKIDQENTSRTIQTLDTSHKNNDSSYIKTPTTKLQTERDFSNNRLQQNSQLTVNKQPIIDQSSFQTHRSSNILPLLPYPGHSQIQIYGTNYKNLKSQQNQQELMSRNYDQRSQSVIQRINQSIMFTNRRNTFENSYQMFEHLKSKVEQKKKMNNAYALQNNNSLVGTLDQSSNSPKIKKKLVPTFNIDIIKKKQKTYLQEFGEKKFGQKKQSTLTTLNDINE